MGDKHLETGTVTEVHGTISWLEDRNGVGWLKLIFEDGCADAVRHEQPIESATDSDDCASQFQYDFTYVEHDRDQIHVGILKRNERDAKTVEIQDGDCPVIALPEDIRAIFIEMNGKTYYLDDTTNEGLAECHADASSGGGTDFLGIGNGTRLAEMPSVSDEGFRLACPLCRAGVTVYHWDWSALKCQGCAEYVARDKFAFLGATEETNNV